MNLKFIYLSLALLLNAWMTIDVNAQSVDTGNGFLSKIKAEDIQVKRKNNFVTLQFDLVFDEMKLKSQEMLILLPVIISADSVHQKEFRPVILLGSKRKTALIRSIAFDDFEFDRVPDTIIGYSRGTQQVYPVSLKIKDTPWLADASLALYEDATGCACRNEYSSKQTLLAPLLYTPQYTFAWREPAIEEVKHRSEAYTAYINFELDKHKLLPNYKNNPEVLKEVDGIIRELQNDKNLQINQFAVTGYASPEGGAQHNMILSKNRAQSFMNYLKETYSIPANIITVGWKGADWDGLYKAMQNSNFSEREEVMMLIDKDADPVRRTAKLKRINNGRTYTVLLKEYYPVLRRTEYVVSYVSKPFSLTEAREVIKTKPHMLSLHEMYRVAQSYSRDSEDFKHAFSVMERFYPNDETVKQNRAVYLMESKDWTSAIALLEGIQTPEAENNLGICYYYLRDFDKAEQYMKQAAQSGDETAKQNLREMLKAAGN